ncbi:MAG: glucose-1-phosphate adenylyltransferase [Christensenellaceae bacterium]|nr:glucose-1-phosphate adenylyltransferase [Christensenellaceae bacterium]
MTAIRKECVAMLLAGGQGTRLYSLTQKVAKPAVPFGGKYRIIDFPLSNTINSGIDTIGVLTQYQPFELNQYIGNGQPWDLDRLNGGAFVLPPYVKAKSGEWYKGTANAIYQNIDFIDRYNPEFVVILSGDHIYKMDYAKMVKSHKKNSAACTIAVLNVPLENASRFGIMNTRPDGTIFEFEEKPKKPKSTKASMGIYVFTWSKLRAYLIADEESRDSENDFGKNIIPSMLKANEKLVAYDFQGYWKDVGTISSLWEANMDLLNPESGITLEEKDWKIYARNAAEPPHHIGKSADVAASMVSEGCNIDGKVLRSVISTGVDIEPGAEVYDSVIMPDAKIRRGAIIKHAIVGWGADVREGARIGETQTAAVAGEWRIAVVAPEVTVPHGASIKAGERFE